MTNSGRSQQATSISFANTSTCKSIKIANGTGAPITIANSTGKPIAIERHINYNGKQYLQWQTVHQLPSTTVPWRTPPTLAHYYIGGTARVRSRAENGRWGYLVRNPGEIPKNLRNP